MRSRPRGNWSWIVPAGTRDAAVVGIGADVESLIVTGSNSAAGAGRTLPPRRPRRYKRRQLKTWFALIPCARATRATDDPGWKLSSTIRRFSAIEYLRRLGVFGVSANAGSIVTRAELLICLAYGSRFQNDLPPTPNPGGRHRTLTEEGARLEKHPGARAWANFDLTERLQEREDRD